MTCGGLKWRGIFQLLSSYTFQTNSVVPYSLAIIPPLSATYFHGKEGGHNVHFHLVMKARPLMFTLTIPRYKVHAQKLCIATHKNKRKQDQTKITMQDCSLEGNPGSN